MAAESLRRMLARAVDSSPVSIIITDPNGVIEYVNPHFLSLTGFEAAEVIGRTPRILKSGYTSGEEYQRLWRTIKAGETWHGEFLNRKKSGETFWEAATIGPVLDDAGRITHFIAIKEDVTALKEAEAARQAMEDELHRARRLESLGQMARGMAHEFNNMLMPILGLTEVVMEELPPNGDARANLQEVHAAALRAQELVRKILAFSRTEAGDLQAIDLGATIRDVLVVLRAGLPNGIAIATDLPREAIEVAAHPTDIYQMLANLAANCRDALEGRPDPGISFALDRDDRRMARISVRDNGIGMDSLTRERLFEPFFTTKEVGMGTGMGLAIVHGIVTRLGGAIRIDSTPGEGTMVEISLPAVKTAEDASA